MTKVLRWGCNLGVKIPSRVARATRLTHGQQVTITLEKGRIVVEPLPHVPTLERLLAGVTVPGVGRGESRPALVLSPAGRRAK